MSKNILETIASGQLARLIPAVADSKREERATSSLLASFMIVPSYAISVLSDAGASIGKRSKITCYTEVVFKSEKDKTGKVKTSRPDGLIVVRNGSKEWSALIESKIGNAELTNEQVEEYLDLAKQHKIDAVITISNQFATTPTHHPLTIAKAKTRSVELYHFSWLSLKSKAVLLTGAKGIEDPEQAYILSELVRYLSHDNSGITSLTKMPAKWKDLCAAVQNGVPLAKNNDFLVESVSGWHQLLRHLALSLSMKLGQSVDISLSRAREKDPELNFTTDCVELTKNSSLRAEFVIPNAASRLSLSADILRKVLVISMRLEAPKDKSRSTASINWLTRQLKNVSKDDLSVRAIWPKRITDTMATLSEVIDDPTCLVPDNVSDLPTHLEVVRVIDMAGRFKGAKTFVEDASSQFPKFYHDAGQHLSKWVPQAPKIKEKESQTSTSPTIFSMANFGADIVTVPFLQTDNND
jgi:hypothetical protein